MKRTTLALIVSFTAPWAVGCQQGETAPAPPTLGEQIDRMGRPGITTALIDPINLDGQREQLQNEYNSAADSDRWLFTNPNNLQETRFRDLIRTSVALFDGLDGVCGDQFLVYPPDTTPARYDSLAITLTYDALFLNTGNGNCGNTNIGYLAVERNYAGYPRNFDCGGRPPNLDVIDRIYTDLTRGDDPNATNYPDGVAADSPTPSLTEFPFLAAPQ
jgi:hypothetical protein